MVFLQILKIIGFVLLGILGLILLLVGLLLFVPIRYKGRGVKNDETYLAEVKVSWLLALVMFKFRFDKNGLGKSLRIAFIYLFKDNPKKETESAEGTDDAEDSAASESSEGNEGNEEPAVLEGPEGKEENAAGESNEAVENVQLTENSGSSAEAVNSESDEGDAEGISEEFNSDDFDEALKGKSKKSKKKKKSKEEKPDKEELTFAKRLLNLYENRDYVENAFDKKREAVDKTWNRVIKLIKHILPRKLYGRIYFGFDDPSTTGKVLGVIAILYGRMGEKLKIRPNFEEKELDADARLKGNIRIFTVLLLAALIYFNKDMRKLVKYIKHCTEVNIDEEKAEKQKEKENG